MNIPILIATALSTLTLAAHFFGGGPQYHTPAMLSSLSLEDKAIYSLLWHAITTTLIINTLALAYAALRQRNRPPLIIIVSAQYLMLGILFVGFGLSRLGELWTLPQWIAFFLISGLALFGLRKKNA